MLHLSQVDALIAQSFEATGRPDLGFDFGRLIRVGSHDILGYALLSSPSLDYAVRVAVRFYRLMTPTFRLKRSVTLAPTTVASVSGSRLRRAPCPCGRPVADRKST